MCLCVDAFWHIVIVYVNLELFKNCLKLFYSKLCAEMRISEFLPVRFSSVVKLLLLAALLSRRSLQSRYDIHPRPNDGSPKFF